MGKKELTVEQHKDRHKMLHRHFDELSADFIRHNTDKLPSETTVMELIVWSNQQTENPTEEG